MGRAYHLGQGVDIEFTRALDYFLLAADQRLLDAQFALGMMYQQGHGVIKDLKQAKARYTRAAKQKHVEAAL